MKDNTATLREEMIGHLYFSDINHPVEMGRHVVNVVVSGNGHCVSHSDQAGRYLMYSALRVFQKRYPFKMGD